MTAPRTCRLTAPMVLCLALGACAGVPNERLDDARGGSLERRIELEVIAALVEDAQVNAAPVRVSARAGVVRLSGFVASDGERERALRAARGVGGVTRVVDELEVRGAPGT